MKAYTFFKTFFRRSPAKRPKLLAVTQDDHRPSKSDLVSMLNAQNTPPDINKEPTVELPPALSIFAAVTPVCQKVDKCVVDWSLKTKVRFTSKSPFAFSSTLKVWSSVSVFKRTEYCQHTFFARHLKRLLE